MEKSWKINVEKEGAPWFYPMENNISCIHFVVVSLQHSLQRGD